MKKKMLSFVMITILLSGFFSLQVSANHITKDPVWESSAYFYYLGSFGEYDVYNEGAGPFVDLPCEERIGNYVFRCYRINLGGFEVGYWLHDSDDNAHSLWQAYETGLISDEELAEVAKITNNPETYFTDYLPTLLAGDIEADDKLTIADATALQRALATNEINFEYVIKSYNYYQRYQYLHYDFNDDGEININDVTCIQKELAHIEWR